MKGLLNGLHVKICKSFTARAGREFALDVEFSAPPGITVLFGPSGSGKTTILECITGLLTPDSGSLALGEQTFFDSARRIDVPVTQRKIGYVFQALALFPHMTVWENIAYGLHGMSKAEQAARISAALETFHITPMKAARPDAISGGGFQ